MSQNGHELITRRAELGNVRQACWGSVQAGLAALDAPLRLVEASVVSSGSPSLRAIEQKLWSHFLNEARLSDG